MAFIVRPVRPTVGCIFTSLLVAISHPFRCVSGYSLFPLFRGTEICHQGRQNRGLVLHPGIVVSGKCPVRPVVAELHAAEQPIVTLYSPVKRNLFDACGCPVMNPLTSSNHSGARGNRKLLSERPPHDPRDAGPLLRAGADVLGTAVIEIHVITNRSSVEIPARAVVQAGGGPGWCVLFRSAIIAFGPGDLFPV